MKIYLMLPTFVWCVSCEDHTDSYHDDCIHYHFPFWQFFKAWNAYKNFTSY